MRSILIAAALLSPAPAQLAVELTPTSPGEHRLGYSPKGAKVQLSSRDGQLFGRFRLGHGERAWIDVALSKSTESEHWDRLQIDADRDGAFDASEVWSCRPSEQRGKIWSSFSATVDCPVVTRDGDQQTVPYPLSLWFVADPDEPQADPILRFSRRGWHEGTVDIGGQQALVMLCERDMDGAYDRSDWWALGGDRKTLLGLKAARPTSRHAWFDGAAYQLEQLHPSGLYLTLVPFDPGVTEAEERELDDVYAKDRREARAAKPVAFLHDFEEAMTRAKAEGKRLLVDFETTWCGPCKVMDQLVYTAQRVVTATESLVAVKVDGDERKDLVKRYSVKGYPTIVVLDGDREIRRASGYQSVAALLELLK